MKGRRLESILVGLPVAYLQNAGSSAGNMRIREYFLDFSAARLSDYSSEVTRPSRQSTDSSLWGISPLRPFGRSYRITDFHPCVKEFFTVNLHLFCCQPYCLYLMIVLAFICACFKVLAAPPVLRKTYATTTSEASAIHSLRFIIAKREETSPISG